MILSKLEENWSRIEKIGEDAEERGRPLGLRPSWADDPKQLANESKKGLYRRLGDPVRLHNHK